MARKEKKYHYIYKTTNIINGKYYIGMHSTNNLDDGYMGSGKRLWYSINYHGKDNHVCEILEHCDTRKELKEREREIVNEELLSEDLCMNLQVGGQGGFSSEEHRKKCQEAGGEATKEKFNSDVKFKNIALSNLKKGRVKLFESGAYKKEGKGKGRKHSEETKLKMSESSKGQGSGSSNSQYGTCWITNEVENKKIKRGDLIPEGWRLGRKMN